MERLQRQLVNRLEQAGVRILEINLYDLSIEILKERDIWDQIVEMEDSVSKEQLKELLQGVLDPSRISFPGPTSVRAPKRTVRGLNGTDPNGNVFPVTGFSVFFYPFRVYPPGGTRVFYRGYPG